MEKSDVLQLGYEELFKRHPFTTWMSITFKRPTDAVMARKALKYFFKHLNDGKEVFYQKYLLMWVFFENNLKHPEWGGSIGLNALLESSKECLHKANVLDFNRQEGMRKGVHMHALVNQLAIAQFPLLKRECNAFFGNTDVAVPHDGVISYVAKKCWSPNAVLDDWDFLRINSRRRK